MIIKNLKKTYQGRAVLNIDEFTFEQGIIYAVVGANGSGKSTLLKCLAGTVAADEKGFLTEAENINIGYMPQSSFAFKMSLMKNLLIGCKNTKENRQKAQESVTRFDLTDKIKIRGDRLSGGERQKMALIRLIMSEYDYILLDEPTSAMDAFSTKEAEKIITEYCRDNGSGCIVVTHSIKQAQRIADEIIFMHEGKIEEHASAGSFIQDPQTKLAKDFLEFFGA